MSRSVERTPWMKMMHLMVNRRRVPHKKPSLVNETLYDGLATFAEESGFRKQSLKHPPHRSFKCAEAERLSSPRNFGDEAVRRKDFEDAWKEACEDGRRDTKQLDNISGGPTGMDRLGDVLPEKLTADDSTGKFAYISLDGRLINGELATSASSIGGGLGCEEAKAWEDFAPMQRVLIVAVSAAAAASAKHRNREEIDLLRKTVETRENELIALKQQLSELCKQSNTNAPVVARSSPKTPVVAATRERCLDASSTKVKLDLHDTWSSSKPDARRDSSQAVRENGPSTDVTPCKGESVFSSSSFPAGDEAWAKEEAKWYVNPMVETSQDFYDISTPERTNSMFSVCNPAVQGSFEWTVLRSSFANRDTAAESPPIQQVDISKWRVYPRNENKEHKAMRAVCAAVVLDLRERMLTVLDKEASLVMAALDTSVEDAKTQIASMHLGVASCWNASVPKALAALSLSPSEFDTYLNETQGASTWSDISKIEESVVAWRQYLEMNCGAKVPSERMSPQKWRSTVSEETSNTSACPRCCSAQDDDPKLGSLACPKNSAAEITDQLIRELDKAAAKVAVMERQMKKLEQDVTGCDSKQSCSKLSERTKQELENQVKECDDVAELIRQLRAKEVEVADLKTGQQNLKRKSKTRKIEEESILCPIASPNGYGAIFWERAAGQKKTKFHIDRSESKTKSNLLLTIDEPEALMDSQLKAIEELKEDHQRRNAELDKQLAAAETNKAATGDRLAVLEELCKQKDCTLSFLRQDTQSLESKVQGSKGHQSSAVLVPRARRNSASSGCSPSSSSGYHGASQKQRFSEKYARNDPILEHIGRCKGHYRNLHYISMQKHEELTDDGRSEQEYSSPPGSTIGDDCSVNSLAFSETEVESRLGSEYCSSGDDSRYHRINSGSGSYAPTLPRTKSSHSLDLRRAVTSTATSARKIPTGATSIAKKVGASRTLISGEAKKQIGIDPNSPRSTTSSKVQQGSAAAVNHRRSSSLDMNSFKLSNACSTLETCGGSLDGQETSAVKRKRWV